MNALRFCMHALVPLFAVVAFDPAYADDPIPITADEAFDAVQRQVVPGTDVLAKVVLVDVRDPQEIFSSGAAAQVNKIAFPNGKKIEPDWREVRLVHDGKFIEYYTDGRYNRVRVDKVEAITTAAISYNIKLWDRTETGWNSFQTTADAFAEDLVGLINATIDETDALPHVIILYCRTGGRSSYAGQLILNGSYTSDGGVTHITSELFPDSYTGQVYEIDDPYGSNSRGGFSGNEYRNVFNGYAGFPGRITDTQDVPSASWMDSGLPVTRAKPLPLPE